MMQALTVDVLVAWALLYAAWTLMPAAWRRALLRGAGRCWPSLATRAGAIKGGCGDCDGCASTPKPTQAGTPQSIRIHRRQG